MGRKKKNIMTTETTENQTNTETEEKKDPAYRVLEVVQHEFNPDTGEDLHFNEDTIALGLRYKSIKRWAWVCHDRDRHEDGTPKGKHWHVVIYCEPAQTIERVAKWFGVAPNFVKKKTGRGAFLDCAQYLTHEKFPAKAQYPDEAVHSNVAWRQLLTERAEAIERYGTDDLNFRDRQRIDVLKYGKTLKQCKEEDPLLFVKEIGILQKCRAEYLYTQPAPKSRVNFYICGDGGVGKGQNSRALARALFPELKSDDEIFFEIGGDGVSFEGYDGQPVIIWNDFRAKELLFTLGSRSAVFNVFDTIPTNLRQNVKYSSVKLLNCVNIVNSVEPYTDFCDGLAGEYVGKDGTAYKAETSQKQQSYRRFPFCLEVFPSVLTFKYSVGYVENNHKKFLDIEEEDINGNSLYINRYVSDYEQRRKLEQKLFAIPLSYYKKAMSHEKEEAPANFFENFGTRF